MNSNTLKTLFAALFFLAACKKNSNQDSGGNDAARNKPKLYITEYHTAPPYGYTDTFQLGYDDSGRLTSAIKSNAKWTFTYPADGILEWDFSATGQPSDHERDFYKNGLIDSTFRIESSQGYSDTMVGQFEYNGDLLTRMTNSWISQGTKSLFLSVLYTYDNNGNVTKTVQTDAQNANPYTNEYTYTDKPGPLPVVFPINVPVQSKNLPATQKISWAGSAGTKAFSYEYDAAGRLVKQTAAQDSATYYVYRFVY